MQNCICYYLKSIKNRLFSSPFNKSIQIRNGVIMNLKKYEIRNYFIINILLFLIYLLFKQNSLTVLIIWYMFMLCKFIIKDMKKDLFSVSSLFLIHYSMYLLYIPIRQLNKNYFVDWYYLAMDREIGSKVMLICGIIAISAFILIRDININLNRCTLFLDKNSMCTKIKNRIFNILLKPNKILNPKTFSNFIIFIGTVFFLIGIWKMGGGKYLISKYEWNSDRLKEIGIMTTGIQIAFTGISLSFYTLLKEKKFSVMTVIKWPISYIFIFLAGVKFIQGGRIQVLMICITLVAIYNYESKKISFKKALLIVLLGVILLGYIGYYRDYKTLVPNNLKTMLTYMLGGSAGMEYFLNSYTNFTSMYVISEANISYIWGGSILDGLIFLIPRFILPNKEEVLFITRKMNEMNNIEIISPVGGLNLAAQNLINGNVIFTVIFMMILSVVFICISKYRDNSKDGVLLYCMLLPYLIVSLIRNPMHYAIKEIIQFCVIPYIIFVVLKVGDCYKDKSSV